MAKELIIKIDSPLQGLLETRAKENGTTAEYEASLALSRELGACAKKFVQVRPSKGNDRD